MFFNFGPGFVDDDNDNRNDSDKMVIQMKVRKNFKK